MELPRERAESFRRGLERNGATGSAVLYGWITQAARYANEGRMDLLPAVSSAPQSGREPTTLYYTMDVRESADIGRVLGDAGSSVRAVVAACISAWEAADYSAVRMVWPTRASVPAAA